VREGVTDSLAKVRRVKGHRQGEKTRIYSVDLLVDGKVRMTEFAVITHLFVSMVFLERNVHSANLVNLTGMKITVGITDDQSLFVKSLTLLINSFEHFTVVLQATNGEQLLEELAKTEPKPDLLLMDVNMPEKDGIEAARIIRDLYPQCKIVALSVRDDDTTVINMFKSGCSAYLLKDVNPDELERALNEVYTTGLYNGDASNINYRRLLKSVETAPQITDREKEFLLLAGSDLTYKQIATRMHLSPRTIDGYREALFEKLNVQSRVGMILEAVRRQLISIN